MVNNIAATKCTSGYASNAKKQIAKNHFPLNKFAINAVDSIEGIG